MVCVRCLICSCGLEPVVAKKFKDQVKSDIGLKLGFSSGCAARLNCPPEPARLAGFPTASPLAQLLAALEATRRSLSPPIG